MSSVKNIILGMAFLTTGVSCVSCSKKEPQPKNPRVETLLNDYVSDPTDKQKIVSGWREGVIGAADAQASLDSAAYKSIFDGTQLAKDSKKLREFNSISLNTKIPRHINTDMTAQMNLSRKLRGTINTIDEFNNIKHYVNYMHNTPEDTILISKKQYVLDSIYYNKFFERNNLKTGKVLDKLMETTKKIRP